MSLTHLPSATIKLITSSQVITSVSSVVKELVENAIDADATNIDVKLENNGFHKVEVKDDGRGINKSEMINVCLPSYTSKIKEFSDLDSLESYGFRGEALSALCQVANVAITTRTSGDELAAEYSFGKSGEILGSRLSHHGVGTQIVASNLFENLPVRKQYLNSGRRGTDELKRVENIVKSLAVIHVGLRVTFSHNKCRLWQKTPVATLKQSFMQAVGHNIVSKLEELAMNNNEMRIQMLIPKKDCTDLIALSNHDAVMVFINKRPVRHKKLEKILMKHINTCFEGQIPAQKYAHCLVSVEVTPSGLDVNLEPNKSKVLFKEEVEVLSNIEKLLITYYESSSASDNKLPVKCKISSSKLKSFDSDNSNQNGQSLTDLSTETVANNNSVIGPSQRTVINDPRIDNEINFNNCVSESILANGHHHQEKQRTEINGGVQVGDNRVANTSPVELSLLEVESRSLQGLSDGMCMENGNVNTLCDAGTSLYKQDINNDNWFNDNFSDFDLNAADVVNRTYMSYGNNDALMNNEPLGKENSSNNIVSCSKVIASKTVSKDNPETAVSIDSLWQNTVQEKQCEPNPCEEYVGAKSHNVSDEQQNVTRRTPAVSDHEWEAIDKASEKWSMPASSKTNESNGVGSGVDVAKEKWSMGQIRTGKEKMLQGSCVLLPTSSTNSPQSSMDQSVSSQMGQRENSAFTKFSREIRPIILQENPGIAFTKVAGMMVRRWRCLKAEERAEYENIARENNEERKRRHSDDKSKEPDPKKVKEKVEQFQKLLNKSVEASPHRTKHTEQKKKSVVRPERKEQLVDFSMDVLTARLQTEACSTVPGFSLIGRLKPSNTWLYRQGDDIGVVRHWGLQETVLNDKLLKDHSVPLTVLDSPIEINERTLDPDLWRMLLSLEKSYSGLANNVTISNQYIVRNGFKIKILEDGDSVSCLLIGVPSVARFYGAPELQETLQLIVALGPLCTLDQCRPLKIRHYIEAEAVRMTRESPALDRDALDDILLYWHSTFDQDRPFSCLHGRPVFSTIHKLNAKPTSGEDW